MPSKQSREEILKKKREAERARLLRIKSDPIKLAEYKEKERQKYLKKIEKGQRKTINQMTDREKRSTRRKWREYSSSYRQKQAVAKNTENYIHETTPPLSDNEAHRENIPPLSDRRFHEAKRRSYKQRKLRNKQIKQKDAMISLLKKKIKAQRQKYKRLREKTAQAKKVQVSPKTRIENMAKNPEHHKEVVKKAIFDRNTCACIVHENIDLKLKALKRAKILSTADSHQKLLEMLCCNSYNEKCLERTCNDCCLKALLYMEFNNDNMILLEQWTNKREMITDHKTNKKRLVTKYKKETVQVLPRDLILKLEVELRTFFRHAFNIVHQYNSIKRLKQSLTEKDVIVHMDFSENFATKYNKEIQAFHFGGSRTQISLHTVVLYLKDSTSSHCTISSNLSHGVGAIWAHLKPVLATLPSTIQNIHFLSDGPVTQYRNKSMFYFLGCKLNEMYPNVTRFTWNYHEAGHGKGAPDGVGATCKRMADDVIARGGDISDIKKFAAVVRERCPSIRVSVIEEEEIDQINSND
nr:unnamed protein product [Callosobruchus analis]